jgi:hypothetical protein
MTCAEGIPFLYLSTHSISDMRTITRAIKPRSLEKEHTILVLSVRIPFLQPLKKKISFNRTWAGMATTPRSLEKEHTILV